MKVLNIDSTIEKWEQSSNNFTGNITEGEKQKFLLYPNHPEYKSLFKITGIIYITDPDTDFILDIEIVSIIQMEIEGAKPTLHDLYEAYLKVRLQWNFAIIKRGMSQNMTIWRQSPPPPYEKLEVYLKTVLGQAYNEN